MNMPDIRWQQHFGKFNNALVQLTEVAELASQRPLSKLEKQGGIQAFKFTHELAWNVLKDFFYDQGDYSLKGSKDVTWAAFKAELIEDGEGWMAMIRSRNLSSHIYDEQTPEMLVTVILADYLPLFLAMQARMQRYVDR